VGERYITKEAAVAKVALTKPGATVLPAIRAYIRHSQWYDAGSSFSGRQSHEARLDNIKYCVSLCTKASNMLLT
jgi:hypothetical protein